MDIFIQNSGEDSASRSKKQVFTRLFSSDTGIFTIMVRNLMLTDLQLIFSAKYFLFQGKTCKFARNKFLTG